nr:MAG TPA: hypothetical protein [Caudoviricetes sp.]
MPCNIFPPFLKNLEQRCWVNHPIFFLFSIQNFH